MRDLQRCTSDSDWDYFLDQVEAPSIFFTSFFLRASAARFSRFTIWDRQDLRALLLLTESDDSQAVVLDDFVIYAGLLFPKADFQHSVSALHRRFETSELVARFLAEKYRSVQLNLVPEFEDVRPFLWLNYGAGAGKFTYEVALRYTSVIDVRPLKSKSGHERFFAGMEERRRRQIRTAEREGAQMNKRGSIATLIESYKHLLLSQGIQVSEEKQDRLGALMSQLLEEGRGCLYEAVTAQGDCTYSLFYAWHRDSAYYLFGAPNARFKSNWGSTFLHYRAMQDLAEAAQICRVDFEGVNSPNRGWFKLSFGGGLTPYYRLTGHAIS